MLGVALLGASCRSPLVRRMPGKSGSAAPESKSQVVDRQQLPEDDASKSNEAAVVTEEAGGRVRGPSRAKAETPPWYKRFWKRAAPVSEAVAEPVKEPTPAPAPKEVDTPSVEKKSKAAKPDKKPWYKPWGKKKVTEPNAEEKLIEAADKAPELPPPGAMFSSSGEPLIKAGYKLRISVTAGGKTELQEQVKTVSGDGEINLPLVGRFICEGLTLKQAGDKLETLFEKYIRDPQASVDFVYEGRQGELSPWGSVVVQGWVRQPGMVNIPPTGNLRLSSALQLAGGVKESADEEKILVTRRNPDGTVKRIFVDLVAVAKRGDSEKDLVLRHGDRIYVQQTVW